MSAGELSTPDQARELLDEIIVLLDQKGHKFLTGDDTYWRGETVALPPALRDRAQATEAAARKFHADAQMTGVTALNELAIVTFASLDETEEGVPAALRYKIVPRTGLQDLLIECHEIASTFPKLPTEEDMRRLELREGRQEPGGFSAEVLEDPAASGRALIESVSANMFRHEIETAEQEAETRVRGEFATIAAEADELILLVHGFAES